VILCRIRLTMRGEECPIATQSDRLSCDRNTTNLRGDVSQRCLCLDHDESMVLSTKSEERHDLKKIQTSCFISHGIKIPIIPKYIEWVLGRTGMCIEAEAPAHIACSHRFECDIITLFGHRALMCAWENLFSHACGLSYIWPDIEKRPRKSLKPLRNVSAECGVMLPAKVP
jgi:hypothetical protein